ncbi:hypothetical protein IFM58399_08558 [Aspergillus lentulus]|uniref:MARVEL domain-containing protein n=1 Tax=Aspergillus lentulus TaxID=293939 RepID=A0AAN5YLQ7_ASPLE|nr:uncharacterized protein IFM58399_08558 [Aspergillus lentulus]KAF4157557.1 hypothetical protein CNMCM6069_005505 [Aspergillus lentulus]KAF4164707.1 hypothetical protein CNMCM6936_008842 [Aspergillus lentulus]KAF4175109.1 hypothetical protein CNMCM8060_007803 [Aspergillus lentulus]KAF4186999.1 hypothetical protein CNMCM7927_004734 [Aspergillus lentulus]KAF4196220.1 hypothetical protein CNMCM8694_005314 [Aspergillus lentulus]
MFSSAVARPLQLITRVLQWSSAVIVMGITSYFIHLGPRGQHLIYQEVISTLSVAFFLPAFISPFMPTALGKFVLAIDVIFSYLWLTAFIFAAQDYNEQNCYFNSPPFVDCSKKKANEAFIFLAFFFTFAGMFLEIASLSAYRRENVPVREKDGHSAAPVTATTAV